MTDRLTELEIRYTDMEMTVESLHDTILQQQQTIDALSLKLEELESRLKSASVPDILPPGEEPPPPHY